MEETVSRNPFKRWVARFKSEDFKISRKGKWYVIAPALIIIAGLIVVLVMNFNLGLDFTGGRTFRVRGIENQQAYSEMRTIITEHMQDAQREHNIGAFNIMQIQVDGGISISVDFQTASGLSGTADEIDEQMGVIAREIASTLQTRLISAGFAGVTVPTADITAVSARASQEHLINTFIAVTVALVAMLLYMLFRFKFTSGVAALIGLVHDVLVMLALTAIFRVQINAAFIAALITVVAYSINNTLILFDRVRGFEKNNTLKESPEALTDRAVKETFTRTMITTVTTLVPIAVLIIAGIAANVPLLVEFAVPILFGLVAGTFSTIFITTSLYVRFENYKLWSAKRKRVLENKQSLPKNT